MTLTLSQVFVSRTHVCGDGAELSEHDGQVEERRREEQTGGADQRIGSGRLRPQLPTHLHAAGHAQHTCDAGDGPENQTVRGERTVTEPGESVCELPDRMKAAGDPQVCYLSEEAQ